MSPTFFQATRTRVALGSLALLGGLTVTAAAQTAPAGDFALNQSERSGAVCRALREYDDPAAQLPRARAWAIRCRGWEVDLGQLYLFDRDTDRALGDQGLWRIELAKRASCEGFRETPGAAGFANVMLANCRSISGSATYQVYQIIRDDMVAVAEGFVPLSDVVENGLRIIAGVEPPPSLADQLRLSSVRDLPQTEASRFVALADAVQQSPEYLTNRSYLTNHAWFFDEAEQAAMALTQSAALGPSDRARTELNFALNISNQRRFDEAEPHFASAREAAAAANDPILEALALNYQSLHFLNQRLGDDARRVAQQAIHARAEIAQSNQPAGSATLLTPLAAGFEVSAFLAASLNEGQRAAGLGTPGLTLAERMRIQDAQAYYVMALSDLQMGQRAGARTMLGQADALLSDQRLARSGTWLRIRVFSALASVDRAEGNAAQAGDRLAQAIQMLALDASLQGTPAEAALYFDMADVEAAMGMVDQALLHYETGFDLMRESRNTLDDSANSAGRYFDLLLSRIAGDTQNERQYLNRFFDTTHMIVSAPTAHTITRLSARLANGGASSGVLERSLEDLKREITMRTANIRRQQDSAMYSAQLRASDEEEIRRLRGQEAKLLEALIQSNPRYGELIAAPATLDKLQANLRPGEIYVKTLLFTDRGYGLAVTNESARLYAIDLPRAQAEEIVAKLRIPFDALQTLPEFDVALAHDLFSKIFGPVQEEVRGAWHLIYEPDGALISFPASAFIIDPESVVTYKAREEQYLTRASSANLYEGLAWLGRRMEISLSVSPTAFLQVRALESSKAPRAFLGLGAPTNMGVTDQRLSSLRFDRRTSVRGPQCEAIVASMVRATPAIPGMDDLIRAVGQQFKANSTDLALGRDFTDTGLRGRNDISDYRVVFFGTHGLLPDTNACLPEPALLTSVGPADSDGLLDASEILDLRLDADLIVLAACNTGGVGAANPDRTGLRGSGEALGGLARDFIYAGGRSLVVSQWSVNRAATIELMNNLFLGGATRQAEALRRAQERLMNTQEFSHPYFWAGFSLLGDGARPMS